MAVNKSTLAPRVVCVVWLLWAETEGGMAGMFPNAVARPSRERLPANSASTIPAKSSLPAQPGQPGRPAHGQQHPPLPLSPRRLPSPAQGVQSWGAVQCRLCLEADVIPTPYSAVFPGGPQGRFSSSSRSWGTGNVSPSPLPTPSPTHTPPHLSYPGELKKKKKCGPARVMKQGGGGGTARGGRKPKDLGLEGSTTLGCLLPPPPLPALVRGLISRLAHVGAGARSDLHEFGAGSSSPNLGQFVQLQ